MTEKNEYTVVVTGGSRGIGREVEGYPREACQASEG